MNSSESQNDEYKRTWRDEYLVWICGYAKVNAGMLCIWRADDGSPVSGTKAQSLMVSMPSKITGMMGIIAEIFYREMLRRPTPNARKNHERASQIMNACVLIKSIKTENGISEYLTER